MTTLEELAAELEMVKSSTPTLEEQFFSTVIPCWNNGIDRLPEATAMTLAVAPWPMRILSVAISWEYWNLTASDTAYWKGELNRGTGPGGFTPFAAKTTQNTGGLAGGGIAARRAWTFDSANWGTAADLAAGDLLRITWTPYGGVAALDLPLTATVGYRAL